MVFDGFQMQHVIMATVLGHRHFDYIQFPSKSYRLHEINSYQTHMLHAKMSFKGNHRENY